MSYFSRLSTGSDWTLTDATPYRMSWGGLAICICHESIAPAFTMAALNASLVALCEMDSEAASSVPHYEASDEHYPTILQEMPMVPCLVSAKLIQPNLICIHQFFLNIRATAWCAESTPKTDTFISSPRNRPSV